MKPLFTLVMAVCALVLFASSVDATKKLCRQCQQVCTPTGKVCKEVCKKSKNVCNKKCKTVEKDCKNVCNKAEDICKKVTKPECVVACIALLGPVAISKAVREKCTNGCQKLHCTPGKKICKSVCATSDVICKVECAMVGEDCKPHCVYTRKVCKKQCHVIPCPDANH